MANGIVDKMDLEIGYIDRLWNVVDEFNNFNSESKEELWANVKAESLEDETKRLMKLCKQTHKDIRWCKTYQVFDKAVKDFLNTCPLIQQLHHKSMRARHWGYLMKATGKEFTCPLDDPTLQLGGLLALELHKCAADVEEITDQSMKEEKMEQQIATLSEFWDKVDWVVSTYKDTDVPLLAIMDEDFEALEADQLIVQGMMASRFLAQFEEEVTGWQHGLAMVADTVIVLTDIQRTWSYLEPLFIGSEEVKKELPETAAKFKGIHEEVMLLLRRARDDKNIKSACNREGLLEELEDLIGQLSVCKKSLADFLDGRRRQFPRFYFTSEADLLDILSNGNAPLKVLIHVPKIYLATKTLIVEHKEHQESHERPFITEFVAGVGVEALEFEPHVQLVGKVEIYLEDVLQAMRHTLFEHSKRCLVRYSEMDRISWLMHGGTAPTDGAQVCLLISGVFYVREVETVFEDITKGDSKAMENYVKQQVMQLRGLIAQTTTSLTKQQRMRIMCMITLDAHNRDIVAKMVRNKVMMVNNFEWQSQLKWYWRVPFQGYVDRDMQLRSVNNERAEIGILNAVLPYDYEYLGNGPRLVITPLTDRIYVTATQALNLKLGCAPAGPAGTGKTESTKDLSSALGKVCYVFNCSPEMDYMSLGNIYKGLASSGAWGCFDEFNRLVPECSASSACSSRSCWPSATASS